MPEKVVAGFLQWKESFGDLADLLLFGIIGAVIGLGQLFASHEVLNRRIIVGRALSTAGLAMAAGVALVWVPDLPKIAQYGVAAGLASLGTSGLERLFNRFIQGRSPV